MILPHPGPYSWQHICGGWTTLQDEVLQFQEQSPTLLPQNHTLSLASYRGQEHPARGVSPHGPVSLQMEKKLQRNCGLLKSQVQ